MGPESVAGIILEWRIHDESFISIGHVIPLYICTGYSECVLQNMFVICG